MSTIKQVIRRCGNHENDFCGLHRKRVAIMKQPELSDADVDALNAINTCIDDMILMLRELDDDWHDALARSSRRSAAGAGEQL